jgi:hypothetical protein
LTTVPEPTLEATEGELLALLGSSPAITTIVGLQYGTLTVTGIAPNARGRGRVTVVCQCGQERVVNAANLRYGTTRSCQPGGCPQQRHAQRLSPRPEPKTGRGKSLPPIEPGERFGLWVVMAIVAPDVRGRQRVLARCRCGTAKEMPAASLRPRNDRSKVGTQHCGCMRGETVSEPVPEPVACRPPDPEPARRLRRCLLASRRAGWDFDTSWRPCVQLAVGGLRGRDRSDWLAALTATEGAWSTAFNDLELSDSHRAVRDLHATIS